MNFPLRALIVCSALALAAQPLLAADRRLVEVQYVPDTVITLDGRLGVQATIAFGEDEHIENVAIGDSASWQITPNKRANIVFVKPLSASARTNLTVVTDRHRYHFDLVASPRSQAIYELSFTYPEDNPGRLLAEGGSSAGLTDAEQMAIADENGRLPVDPATLNFAWERKGAARLLPARVYDDGRATYLGWDAATSLPAILVRNAKGEEGPVNFAVRGDMIVIDDVPASIVLRAGKASALLENRGPPRPRSDTPAVAPPALAAVTPVLETEN